MRLVWVVIPVLLIGIIGVEESYAQCCLGPFSGNLTISEPPKLNDTTQITFEITSASFGPKEVPDYHALIDLPEGFELVSGTLEKTSLWQTEEPFTIQATIKAVQTGDWIINGVGRDSAADSLAVRVSETDAVVQYDVFSPGPIFPSKTFATESILLYSSKLNNNSTDKTSTPLPPILHDQEITLSNIPKLGETATISVTLNLKPEFSQLSDNSTQIIMLENGFSFVNVNASLITLIPKTNLMGYFESLPVVMNVPTVFEFEITPTKIGTWTVHVDGGNYKQRHSFYFIVNNDETILGEKPRIPSETDAVVQYDIPRWIKSNAKWWTVGSTDDGSFAQGIQYLIVDGVLKDPFRGTLENHNLQIPDWIKNTTEWWADDSISNDEFLSFIQYLMNKGIIRIS